MFQIAQRQLPIFIYAQPAIGVMTTIAFEDAKGYYKYRL